MKHDTRVKLRTFHEGEAVFVKNFGSGCRWLRGRIVQTLGSVSFRVQLDDGRLRKCHQDHLRPRLVEDDTPEMSQLPAEGSLSIPAPDIVEPVTPTPQITPGSQPSTQPETVSPTTSPTVTNESNVSIERRYPRRNRKRHEHFEPGT